MTISVPVGVDTRNGVRISKGLDKTELIDLVRARQRTINVENGKVHLTGR
jgi:hypothetical protein